MDDTLPKLGYSIYSDPTNPDHIIIVYMADYLADVDIYLLETPNGGATWNEPVRVNADTPETGSCKTWVGSVQSDRRFSG